MNAPDALLARLDERSQHIMEEVGEIKKLCKEHNGDIRALQLEQARLRGRIYGAAAVLSLVIVAVQIVVVTLLG